MLKQRQTWMDMAGDTVVALFSLAVGLGLRSLIQLYQHGGEAAQSLRQDFALYFDAYGPALAAATLAAFATLGLYRRARYYPLPQRALRVTEGVTLAYIACVFLIYCVGITDGRLPRGAFLIAYVLNVSGAVMIRWVIDMIERPFTEMRHARPSTRDPKHVLVVGGAGYIGSGLVRDLLQDGYRVRVLDSLMYGDGPICDLYGHPNFELVRGDFRNVATVVQSTPGVDAVIHLGAIVGDPACAVNEDETLKTNLAATRLLAEVCRASGVSRLLFASTCSVYGAASGVVDENSWLNPVSLYAATKVDSEKVLLAARAADFHPVILRLATAYGWSYRPRFDVVVNLLAAKAVAEKKIVIYNGEQWRPFIHIRDISRAFRMALKAPIQLVSGQVFNVGSDHMNYTLQDLAQQIASVEPGLDIEYIKNSDARTYKVSFDKIRTQLGFMCEVSLVEGVEEIRQAMRRGQVADYRDSLYSNVQLVKQMQNRNGSPAPEREVELTALRFTKNSHWLRAVMEQ